MIRVETVSELPQAPPWLNDAPLIRRILHRFIDSLDKDRQPRAFTISETSAPELYRFDDQDFVTFQWELLTALDKEYGVISLQCAAPRTDREIYDGAGIRFNTDKEDLVRHWLNRPRIDPYVVSWNAALRERAEEFEDGGAALAKNIIRMGEVNARQIIDAFASMGRELERPVTLRALSARCFWGDSKFLDNREALVRTLYPSRSRYLITRPVLLNAYLPANLEQVVFVENQDSFLALSEQRRKGLGVIYSAGFYGSAQRIRDKDMAVFCYLQSSDRESINTFEAWWLANDQAIPCYFWGDLDFAGMAILKALRKVFPTMEAWRPGYEVLLDLLSAGKAHSSANPNKGQQSDPITTGCVFADQVLLPQLRQRQGFVDQEAVHPDLLPDS